MQLPDHNILAILTLLIFFFNIIRTIYPNPDRTRLIIEVSLYLAFLEHQQV